jgi:hypothetical protein
VTIVTRHCDFAVSLARRGYAESHIGANVQRGGITPLIASKLLRADVIIVDACIVEHGSPPFTTAGGPAT